MKENAYYLLELNPFNHGDFILNFFSLQNNTNFTLCTDAYLDQKKTILYWPVPKEFAGFPMKEGDESNFCDTISLASTESQIANDILPSESKMVRAILPNVFVNI
jgi:hypothetical protein